MITNARVKTVTGKETCGKANLKVVLISTVVYQIEATLQLNSLNETTEKVVPKKHNEDNDTAGIV